MDRQPASDGRSDDQALAEIEALLKGLTSRNRLLLLSQLREPKTVNEIDLTPAVHREGENADRQLTRQGVRHHLSQLEKLGLVRSEVKNEGDGRGQNEYVVDESAVFGVLEEIRDLVAPGSNVPLEPFRTQSRDEADPSTWPAGPKLVLLRGADATSAFGLRSSEKGEDASTGWMIGRSPEVAVCLQYDPFLSAKNSEIFEEDGEFRLVDLRTSRNGTLLNDEKLEPGEEVPLEHGDVIRVGCSSLVFHES